MIELGVEPQRKSVIIAEDEPAHYLILGDFGGRAMAALAAEWGNPALAFLTLLTADRSRNDAAGVLPR